MKRLISQDFHNFLRDYYFDHPNDPSVQRKLKELGFGSGVFGKMITKEEWKKDESEGKGFISFHNALLVFLLGYPDEQLKAKEILVEFSGKDYTDTFEYSKWFMKEYYNVTY